MDGNYIDQSVMDLNLCIYAGVPVLPGAVQIFSQDNGNDVAEMIPGARTHLAIIGESHFFSLRIGQFGFMELLACMAPPPFEGGMLTTPLRLLSAEIGWCPYALNLSFPPFQYSFRGVIQDATKERLDYVARFRRGLVPGRKEDSPFRIVLAHDFSDEAHANSYPPETLVVLNVFAEGRRFEVATVHTYPNEGKLAFTSSALFRTA